MANQKHSMRRREQNSSQKPVAIMCGRVLCVFLVLFIELNAQAQDNLESRLVKTANGPVRGYRDPEHDIFVFYGIPYATEPTGVNKFKPPMPAPIWTQPLEAFDRGAICPQVSYLNVSEKSMGNDCLIANVYIPDTAGADTRLPVVVYVHGGAYQAGYGDLITPKIIVQSKKIIAVTFNYRLGLHGFLCLGTKDIPGNAGMKDQVALLRWVKNNIEQFGGNPDDVTVAGYSAGGSAVDLLMLSKMATGLFNKVIPESGSSLAVWSIQQDPLNNAKAYARMLNFTDVEEIYSLEQFYKTASLKLLTQESFLYRADSTFVFSPCIEQDTGAEMFLDDSPLNILKAGNYNKIPMLYGFTNMEGIFRVQMGYEEFRYDMNNRFSDFLPADLQFDSDEEREEVAEQVKEFYFGDAPIGDHTITSYIDYFTDVMFAYPVLKAVQLHVEAGHDKIFLYEYSFVDEEHVKSKDGVLGKVRGANHVAQTIAVLDERTVQDHAEEYLTESYKKMKSVMRELWLNFMTSGTPVPASSALPAWGPVTNPEGAPYMEIGSPSQPLQLLQEPLLQRRARFWHQIYQKYYRMPAPPPVPPPRPRYEEL